MWSVTLRAEEEGQNNAKATWKWWNNPWNNPIHIIHMIWFIIVQQLWYTCWVFDSTGLRYAYPDCCKTLRCALGQLSFLRLYFDTFSSTSRNGGAYLHGFGLVVWNIILGCENLSKTSVSNWSFRRVVNPLLANSKDCLGFWKVGRVIDLAYPLLTSPLSQWQPCRTGMCHDVATNRFASRSPKAHAINLCNNLICDNNCHSVLHIDRWENRIILKDKRDHLICQPLQTP